jgi:hypothetical protein
MRSRLATAFLLGSLLTAALPALHLPMAGPADVHGQEVVAGVSHERVITLPFEASHVALHWTGAPQAQLSIAFGERVDTFGDEVAVTIDDDAEGAPGEVFSGVLWTGGARFARVTTDRTIDALKVLAIDAGQRTPGAFSDEAADAGGVGLGAVADAAVSMPSIISRAGWGANESYRFNSGGYEIFPSSYNPLQKVIVHHTAGRNDDPNPEATIRAIYYMHAVSRGWGDIDYNFLIDWQGRVYEGRHSRKYAAGEPITGEDLAGNVVRGAHAKGFNDGTVGIALLGNFQNRLPPAAQIASLEKLIAWKLERHGINPLGAGTYTNPNLGNSLYLQNISGHRNVNPTDCPGETFYRWFGTLRQDVADRIAATTGSTVDHTAPGVISLKSMLPDGTGATSIPFGLLFKEPVTGLTATDFTVGGTSSGWTVGSVTGKASGYTVTVEAPSGGGLPDPGTVTLTLADSSVRDLAANVGPGAAVSATATYAHDSVAPTFVLYQKPHRGTSNAESFDWSVTFSEPVKGFTVDDIHLGGPDAGEWEIEWLLGQGANYEFVTRQPALSNGTFTVSLPAGAVTDLAGNPAPASPVVTIKADRSAPTTGTPKVQLDKGTTLNGAALRAGVVGAGTDVGPAGIGSYDVRRSYDGGAYVAIGTVASGEALPWSLTPGHAYRFETRAHDRAGNVGGWVAGPTLHPALTQQTSSSVHWSGATTTLLSTRYSGGSLRYLAAVGAGATYTTTARSLSFVTAKGPTRGTAEIWIDGVSQGMVVLTDPSTTLRYVAFSKTWSSVGTHTIRIVSVGSPARVDIDAFGVIR